MRLPRLLILSVAVLGSGVVASCGSDADTSQATAGPATSAVATTPDAGPAPASGDFTVFAASSLTEAFTAMGAAFEKVNPAGHPVFDFAGSGDLVTQIGQGAPADVFVSADDANMKKLIAAGENAGDPISIAMNSMEIIVEKGNPMGITSVADLARAGLIVVLCADTVPCGKNAVTILGNAGVTVAPASLEDKVKGVVTKVTTGEADAGIVFVTDVQAAGDAATGVAIPDDLNVISNYPAVVTKEATNAVAGQAFIDFVASGAGQSILAEHGFLPAP